MGVGKAYTGYLVGINRNENWKPLQDSRGENNAVFVKLQLIKVCNIRLSRIGGWTLVIHGLPDEWQISNKVSIFYVKNVAWALRLRALKARWRPM